MSSLPLPLVDRCCCCLVPSPACASPARRSLQYAASFPCFTIRRQSMAEPAEQLKGCDDGAPHAPGTLAALPDLTCSPPRGPAAIPLGSISVSPVALVPSWEHSKCRAAARKHQPVIEQVALQLCNIDLPPGRHCACMLTLTTL